jgi:hypothetical protein
LGGWVGGGSAEAKAWCSNAEPFDANRPKLSTLSPLAGKPLAIFPFFATSNLWVTFKFGTILLTHMTAKADY